MFACMIISYTVAVAILAAVFVSHLVVICWILAKMQSQDLRDRTKPNDA